MFKMFVRQSVKKEISEISLETLKPDFAIFIQANVNDPIIRDIIINDEEKDNFFLYLINKLYNINDIINNSENKINLKKLYSILYNSEDTIYKYLSQYFRSLDRNNDQKYQRAQMVQGGATAGAGDSI